MIDPRDKLDGPEEDDVEDWEFEDDEYEFEDDYEFEDKYDFYDDRD